MLIWPIQLLSASASHSASVIFDITPRILQPQIQVFSSDDKEVSIHSNVNL